jgi:polysaccharide biosynthesis protein PelA
MAWAILNRGSLETVRFDDVETLSLDMVKSSGVLGANRHQGALYVALDPAVLRPIVALTTRASAAEQGDGAAIASLISSRWSFSNRITRACGFTVDAQGFGPGEMQWQLRPGRAMMIATERAGVRLSEEIRWADSEGVLKLRIETSAIEPLNLTFDCHE